MDLLKDKKGNDYIYDTKHFTYFHYIQIKKLQNFERLSLWKIKQNAVDLLKDKKRKRFHPCTFWKDVLHFNDNCEIYNIINIYSHLFKQNSY